MYSPKVQSDLVEMLRDIRQVEGKQLAALVDELLRPQVIKRYGEVVGLHRHTLQLKLFETAEAYPKERVCLDAPTAVFRLCADMISLQQERMDVLTLDTKNYLIARRMVFLGSLNTTVVHPREIYAHALADHASSVIIVHNHPSKDTEPSREDIAATKQIKAAGVVMGIPLVDHVIIGDGFTSMNLDGCL